MLPFHVFFLRNFEESFGLGQDASSSFLSVQLSVVVFCRLSSVVLVMHFLCKRLAAASRHAPWLFFSLISQSESWKWYTFPLSLQLAQRTLCAASCAKTKPTERKEGWWVRVVTWCVYTALFSLCTVTFSISFLNGVRTCMHMFNSRGLPFLLQSHFLVLGAKHCEIFMYLFVFLLKCAKI